MSKNSRGNSSQTKDVNNNDDETGTEPTPNADTDTNSVQTNVVSRPMSANVSSEVCELDVSMDTAEVGTYDRMASRDGFERSFQFGWFDKWNGCITLENLTL